VQHVVAFSRTAVVLRHWFEIDLGDASMEHGSRIELRALAAAPHRGGESAAQLITADRPLWRADLFDRLTDEPGSYGVAHYHPEFDGNEPSERAWDQALSADPWSWLHDRFARADRPGGWPIDAQDAREISSLADALVAQARRFAPEHCTSREQCYELTRDASGSVRLMVEGQEHPGLLDNATVARWLS
jgi:hypothetical protein